MSQRNRDDSNTLAPAGLPDRRAQIERLTRIVRHTTMRLEGLAAKARHVVQDLEAGRRELVVDAAQIEVMMDIGLCEDARSLRNDITEALASLLPFDDAGMVVELNAGELERFRDAIDGAKAALVSLIDYAKTHEVPPDEDMLN